MKRLLKWLSGMLAIFVLILIGWVVIIRLYHPIPAMNLSPNHPDTAWNHGAVAHLLPTVNHERILIKVSFAKAQKSPPRLLVNNRPIQGVRTDSHGFFWYFDAKGLQPDTRYNLEIQNAVGHRLCDPWPLKTFPAPTAAPEKVRLLIYTCLGGHDVHINWFKAGPIPLKQRIRLLNRGLSFQPDAVISTGDQIYYDLRYGRTAKTMGLAPASIKYCGQFDRTRPVLGTTNEEVFKKVVSPQIADLYGTALRSYPTFFLLDDHDYFENDEASEKDTFGFLELILGLSPITKAGFSFPMDNFMLDLGRSAQKLYLPEFLPDIGRPVDMPDVGARDRAPGVAECYGTLRYGRLLEALLSENRRYLTLNGKDAVQIHPKAEKWMVNRMALEETRHVLNIITSYIGWSAGKWLDWYPDIRDPKTSTLTLDQPKYMWMPGWFEQHNRILEAAGKMQHSPPIFICGDLHSQGVCEILKSGNLDLRANPVISILSGSLGTGPRGFPSGLVRKMKAQAPHALNTRELMPVLEKNAFILMDFTPEKVTVRFFAWRPPEPVNAIETLQPHLTLEFKRKGI